MVVLLSLSGSIENTDPENKDLKTEDPYENEDPLGKRRPFYFL